MSQYRKKGLPEFMLNAVMKCIIHKMHEGSQIRESLKAKQDIKIYHLAVHQMTPSWSSCFLLTVFTNFLCFNLYLENYNRMC